LEFSNVVCAFDAGILDFGLIPERRSYEEGMVRDVILSEGKVQRSGRRPRGQAFNLRSLFEATARK